MLDNNKEALGIKNQNLAISLIVRKVKACAKSVESRTFCLNIIEYRFLIEKQKVIFQNFHNPR